jgi:hypothetical protein
VNKNQANEIYEALRASTIANTLNNQSIIFTLTFEWDFVLYVKQVTELTQKIIKSNDKLFIVKTNKYQKHKFIETKNKDGLANLLKGSGFSETTIHFPHHKFNPYFELFISKFNDSEYQYLIHILKRIYGDNDKQLIRDVDILNGCIDRIREEGRSKSFNDKVASHQRSINKTSSGTDTYIKELFDLYPRLLAIRLDLTYAKGDFWPFTKKNDKDKDGEILLKYSDVQKHWDSLLKFLEKKLEPGCYCGFVRKLEHSLNKGFQFHLLILINASDKCAEAGIGKIIGEYWNNTATEGKGIYYNCNDCKSRYKSYGIGVIDRNDKSQRDNLKKALDYMIKTDYYIKLALPNNARSFSKGNMPKAAATSKTSVLKKKKSTD